VVMGRNLVLTGFDKNMAVVGDLTQINHRAYAERHGFEFQVVNEYTAGTHPSWQKMRILMERIESFDSILWIDADAFVTNMDFDFTSLIGDRKGLILSKDWDNCNKPDYFSAGVMIVVRGQEATDIFREAMTHKKWENVPLWDQAALQDVFNQKPDLRPFFNIMARRCLNSVPQELNQGIVEPWREKDFICHLTGVNNAKRLELLLKFDWNSGKRLT